MKRIRHAALLVALLGLGSGACATVPADPLDRMHPYLWASHGRLEWFTCRWTTDQPIGVAILGTDEAETLGVRRALAAWEAADLGVRFEEVPADGAQLVLSAVSGSVDRDDGSRGTGRTIADCHLGDVATAEAPAAGAREAHAPDVPDAPSERRARLVRAQVEVARAVGPDALGRLRPLDANEWLGSWVHEIGHALGYQGHLRRGDDPMRLEPDFQRFVGERLRAGKPLESPALRALYAVPSGTVLGTASVGLERTRQLDDIASLARDARVEGPLLRSGDRAARIYWRSQRGKEYGFLVLDLVRALEQPADFVLIPELTTLPEL